MAVTPKIEKAQTASASRISSILGKVNLPFFGVIAALLIFGILNLSYVLAGSTEYSLMRQVMGIGLGIVGMAVCWKIDYRIFEHMIIPLLIIDIVLILSPHLPIIGYSAGGATSWVKIGIRFQPAELAKLVTILLMAAVVARYQGRIDSPKEYLKCIGFLCVPFICIMTQPDLGTGLVLIIIGATIIFVGGANKKLLLITIGLMAAFIAFIFIADPILDNIAGKDVFLKDYQLNRILVFLNEDADPTGAGYNLKQAKIAIGSGGLLGKGLGNATQSALGFLPEAPTDFVFCTIAEQMGFVGVFVLIALFGLLLGIAISMAMRTDDLFGKLIILGVVGMWLFSIFENIGMCCGLMPITGIPLPFISFGSSFMISNFLCIGIICSVWSRQRADAAAKISID